MSILAKKLRPILFSNLRPDFDPALRQGLWNLFNAVDSDLDIAGYIESSTTDEALEDLEAILSGNKPSISSLNDNDFIDEEENDDSPATVKADNILDSITDDDELPT